jgi:hypothetical protein
MTEPIRRGYLIGLATLIAVALVVVSLYLGWLHVPPVVE